MRVGKKGNGGEWKRQKRRGKDKKGEEKTKKRRGTVQQKQFPTPISAGASHAEEHHSSEEGEYEGERGTKDNLSEGRLEEGSRFAEPTAESMGMARTVHSGTSFQGRASLRGKACIKKSLAACGKRQKKCRAANASSAREAAKQRASGIKKEREKLSLNAFRLMPSSGHRLVR